MIMFLAFDRVRRFDVFQTRTKMARSLLANRLARLVDVGVFCRVEYQQRPVRYEYRLTPMGRDLFGASLMIVRWEKLWFPDPEAPIHRLRHACGHVVLPELRCSACDLEVVARDVLAEDGPGAGFDPPSLPRAQRRSRVARIDPDPHEKMLERALEVIGDRWITHTIASAFTGVRRFGAFQRELGVAPNILSERLARLIDLGIFERQKYQERPERFEYRLTPVGRDLFPLIVELIRWGDRWLATDKGVPQILTHRPCGKPLVPRITCNHCHEVVTVTSTMPG